MIGTIVMCVFILQFQTGDHYYESMAEIACRVEQELSDPYVPEEGHKILLVDCSDSLDRKALSDKIEHQAYNDSIRHVLYEKDCF